MVRTVERSLYDYDKKDDSAPQTGGGEWEDGFCSICTTARAPHICVKCRKLVCSEHFVSIMGLCVECAPVKDSGKNFKITEQPSRSKPADPSYEPTIQDIAKFGPREDIREVVVVRARKKKPQESRGMDSNETEDEGTGTQPIRETDEDEPVKDAGKRKEKEFTIDWV